MREVQAVWAAAFDLAWKLGLIVIAIGLCALMPAGEARDDAGRKAAAGATNPDDASLFSDDVRVTMDARGRPFAHCTVRAEVADAVFAADLGRDEGSAVLAVDMLYQTADQRRVEYTIARHPADIFSIAYDAPNDLA